jgi:hypothetical protein
MSLVVGSALRQRLDLCTSCRFFLESLHKLRFFWMDLCRPRAAHKAIDRFGREILQEENPMPSNAYKMGAT